MKKLFIISLALLIIVLFFLGIYNFAFKKNTYSSTSNNVSAVSSIENIPNNQNVPTQKTEKITAISQEGVLAAAFDKKNNTILYYSSKDGTEWKSDPDGKGWNQISSEKTDGIKSATWSANRNKALIVSNTNGNDVFYEYDGLLGKKTPLKNGLDTATWDNLGSKIFYKYFDQNKKARTLNIANPDGSGWQKIADTDIRNISIEQIPMTSIVSYWNAPTKNEETKLQSVGVAGGEIKTIFQGKSGADYLWNPTGANALISSLSGSNNNKITLGLIKIDGSYEDLGVPTFVSKCVWSVDGKTIYYALPGDMPESAQLPDDYLAGKITAKDTFWKMDTTTGKRDRLVDPSEITNTLDSSNLFLSPTEDSLYFINKVDKKLYKIAL